MGLILSDDMDFNDSFDCERLIKCFQEDEEKIKKAQKETKKMFDVLGENEE